MKCTECKFANRHNPNATYGTCQLELPRWVHKGLDHIENTIYFGDAWSTSGCDLGLAKVDESEQA